VAAAIASGGALMGAVGAAGSLGAALSTSSGAIAASAATLDVMSLGVEVGSVLAAALGDERAVGILGWVGAGVGLASLGTSVASVAKGARKVGAASDHGFDRTLLSGRVAGRQEGAAVTKIDDPRQLVDDGRLKVIGAGTLGSDDVMTRVYARWRRYEVGDAVHYAPDMTVNMLETTRMAPRIAQKNPEATKFVFHMGVHGRARGQNYVAQGAHRPGPRNLFSKQVRLMQRRFGDQLNGKPIVYSNLSGMQDAEVDRAFRTNGVHIHVKCYGAADEKLRELAGVGSLNVYTGPRNYYVRNGAVVPVIL
jgi:hypothetical protein